jgi:hypothetical protein
MFTYQARVSNEMTYLWGGAGIQKDIAAPFFLLCRVDEFGETIELVTESIANGRQPDQYGTLKPGETYIVALDQVCGVLAKTTQGHVDSIIWCTVFYQCAS